MTIKMFALLLVIPSAMSGCVQSTFTTSMATPLRTSANEFSDRISQMEDSNPGVAGCSSSINLFMDSNGINSLPPMSTKTIIYMAAGSEYLNVNFVTIERQQNQLKAYMGNANGLHHSKVYHIDLPTEKLLGEIQQMTVGQTRSRTSSPMLNHDDCLYVLTSGSERAFVSTRNSLTSGRELPEIENTFDQVERLIDLIFANEE